MADADSTKPSPLDLAGAMTEASDLAARLRGAGMSATWQAEAMIELLLAWSATADYSKANVGDLLRSQLIRLRQLTRVAMSALAVDAGEETIDTHELACAERAVHGAAL